MSRVKSSYGNGILTIDHGEGIRGEFAMNELEDGFLEREEIIREALVYAIKQKLADRIAGMKDASGEEKLAAQEELWRQLTVGRQWNTKKTGSGKVTKSSVMKRMEGINIPGLTEEQKRELLTKLLG